MCGIAGFVDYPERLTQLIPVIEAMSHTLAHRGPDAQGQWVDEQARVALGHRRLSILDLSPEGAQPMTSASGRYVIVFNGEVYNFQSLREELERAGHRFRGHSDTEVMLAAFEEWGVRHAVTRFIGMFSFGLWDGHSHTLSLVRDRLGIKPLYYGLVEGVFVFASELKALRAVPGEGGEINRSALAAMMRYCYIPSPYTIYKQFNKLPPGSILTLSVGGARQAKFSIIPYWSLKSTVMKSVSDSYTENFDDAVAELDQLLRDAIKLRMLADVPLGAFLSGGIDSSTVVALMQSQSSRAIKTFTVGFHDNRCNEAPYARAVANYLGTDHFELYVSHQDVVAAAQRLARFYDEPFADSSQIPTLLVSELAIREVKVSLSGDGGDELFHGYHRYFEAERRWRQIGWLPRAARIALRDVLKATAPAEWSKPHTLAAMLASRDSDELYKWLLSSWKEPCAIVRGAEEAETIFERRHEIAPLNEFAQELLFYDMSLYLPDDILVKMDRASMSVGLEARVPLLDHRIVEFAWRLPLGFKCHKDCGKRILKQVLSKYVPLTLVDRPKMGFGIPIGELLRGPLREWAESLLNGDRIDREGYLVSDQITRKWREHLSGARDWHYELWNVLMFQSWLEFNGSVKGL